MRFDEINWENYTTKTVTCSDYESDGNTVRVAGRKLIPLNDIIGEGHDNLALRVLHGKYNNTYRLYKKIGELWIDAEVYIHPSIDTEEFRTAIDNRKELFTVKKFISDIEQRCDEVKHIKNSEIAILSALGEMKLVVKCLEARKAYAEKREEEEERRCKEAEERERKYLEELEKQYAEEKEKVINGIKNHEIIYNVDCDNGKNVIVSMCEELGIKIPIRTKGFMLDKTNLYSFRYGNDGTITIWGRGNSQKVWDILSQLCNYYK